MNRAVLVCALVALAGARPADCGILLEGFDDLSALAGSGWIMRNNSNPAGTRSWFQGSTNVFTALDGAANSYAAVNFDSTGNSGTISNWLITPEFLFADGDSLTFSTRTVIAPEYPDRLEVRFSAAGASSNVGSTSASVGDFTTLLLSVNPGLTISGYPNGWTEYTVSLSGLSGDVPGRFAFRYYVTNAGLLGANSDYIGIDSVRLDVQSAPEPMTMLLTGGSLIALAAWTRRRRIG
jgi:hypothetical protein